VRATAKVRSAADMHPATESTASMPAASTAATRRSGVRGKHGYRGRRQ